MTGKILVVDDIEHNVRLLEAKLTNEYYTVYPAYSGAECLACAKKFSPDIILLDIMMPEMDGFETCIKLKADPETAHIPVVMVTALSEVEDRIRGLSCGADDFITKPIDELHLFARVKSLIRLKTMLDELRLRDKTSNEFGIENSIDSSSPVTGGKIIVIDDDIVQSKKIKSILEDNKGHLVSIQQPEDALSIVSTNDLIIINTLLDDFDGLRLGVQIRSQEKHRQTPIMILVDEDDKEFLAKALEVGIDDYLITPMDNNELIARVTTQIRRKQYQDALRSSYKEGLHAAVVDSLTKLYNRRYLDAHLNNIVNDAIEKGSDLSLMTIDIDHFKEVNDKPGWGHHIGDEVLQELAKRLLLSVRSTDLATRPGGEEFVVIMPNTDIETAYAIAERTRNNIGNNDFTISAEPGHLKCTVSIGVSMLEEKKSDTGEKLLKRSDEALYQAKGSGRNKVVISSVEQW